MSTSQAPSSDAIEQLALYRRAANYIAAAMIYLQDNAPARGAAASTSTSSTGCSATGARCPGINLIYAGLNRLILETGLERPAASPAPATARPRTSRTSGSTAASRTCSPELSRDREGLGRLVRSFSWPGGFPSHLAPIVPGTIHEGGELGYALATAFGAALDNPDLIVGCIIGDGEAETGPTAGAWHSNKFLDPATCGAVLPILHVNGYKIANPTIYKAMSDEELTKLFEGFGWHPLIVEGDGPRRRAGARRSTRRYGEIRELQDELPRGSAGPERPRWPMIVAALAQGLDRHQGARRHPGRGHLEGAPGARDAGEDQPRAPRGARGVAALLHARRSCSTRTAPRSRRSLAACPTGDLRMGANPHVNGGKLRKPLNLPDLDEHARRRPERRARTTAAR